MRKPIDSTIRYDRPYRYADRARGF